MICTQRRLLQTGARMAAIMDLGPDDVGYVCMPLFHSNALMVGWAPSIAVGASVGLARRFSASGWLPDVRRYGATYFNYTGKPLSYLVATPEQPDDADNTVRVAFGNEGSPEVVEQFARRFGVEVIDAFGATEGGIAVNRDEGMRAGSVGKVGDTVKVVDEAGVELPRATFGDDGRLLNADECVGEIVNTAGAGPFEGYYNNDEATSATLRNGWYWSGDLGYVDDDGFLYFAGRIAEWIRVDGENFPAGPIEAAVGRHPDVVLAAVYGVPDEHAGDQVMAAVQLRAGAAFDPVAFASFVDSLAGVGPKWRPRYVRVVDEFPTTGHQQDREADAGAREVPPRPLRRRRAVGARARRRCLPAVHRGRRVAVARRARRRRPRSLLGPVDGPLVHARRGSVRVRDPRLAAREPRAAAGVRVRRRGARLGTPLAGEARRRSVGRHPVAARVRRSRRDAGRGRALQRRVRP